MTDNRYDRQIRLFGERGQRRISAARLVVLGAGGLGMPLVQHMAYLGVGYFAVADSGLVSESNLGHLVGAGVDDLGLYKVIVAERLIRAVQPCAEVTALMVDLPHAALATAVAGATVVVGCFQRETPRLVATMLCSAAGVPYVDLATRIRVTRGRPVYGGRVIVAADGTGCVSCLEVLDRQAMALERDSGDPYGVDDGVQQPANSPPPSVVTVDGVVGSLAAVEIMCLLTGLRRPARQLTYRGERGSVERSWEHGPPGCPYCARWRQNARPVARDV